MTLTDDNVNHPIPLFPREVQVAMSRKECDFRLSYICGFVPVRSEVNAAADRRDNYGSANYIFVRIDSDVSNGSPSCRN